MTIRIRAIAIAVFAVSIAHASAQIVAGTANVFGAGHVVPPAPGGGGGGTLPPAIDIPLECGWFEVLSVTGSARPNAGFEVTSPDGYSRIHTDIFSWGGVSGIRAQRYFFLAGVFIGDSEPTDPSPPRRDFGSTFDFTSLTPLMHQQFYIGDGVTGTASGARQRFIVPSGATRLYLGFADAFDADGDPGAYDDNVGALNVEIAFFRCDADLNCDAIVDFTDYLQFLNLFSGMDITVDFTLDGLVDFSDYLEFLNLYAQGC